MPLVHRRVPTRLALVLLVALVATTVAATPAGADDGPPTYRAPVAAPVGDPFRAPARPYGPQNLGLEFATHAGDEVRAAATGTVSFAGRTPTGLWLTLDHPDGLRTSYGPLATLAVTGGTVRQGAVVGTAAGPLHLSARLGDTYLDPALLLAGWAPDVRIRLVPAPLRPGADDELARQRFEALGDGFSLGRALGGGAHLVLQGGQVVGVLLGGTAQALADQVVTTARWGVESAAAISEALEVIVPGFVYALQGWVEQFGSCTPGAVAPPAPPPDRADHIVLLVAGIGSSSGHDAVDDVDAEALGYDPGHVLRFSYAGGLVPDPADAVGATPPARPYGAADTYQSIDTSAHRLRVVLEAIARAHPGVPVDVVAHSMGGVVALRALQDGDAAGLPSDLSVVALASPLGGSTMAAASGIMADGPGVAAPAVSAAATALGTPPPDAPAVRQLAAGSDFMYAFHHAGLPPRLDVRAVNARFDLVVPSTDSRMGGVRQVVVDTGPNGVTAHARLPSHVATTRELALAEAGMGPTCRPLTSVLADWEVAATQTALTTGLVVTASAWGATGPPTRSEAAGVAGAAPRPRP